MSTQTEPGELHLRPPADLRFDLDLDVDVVTTVNGGEAAAVAVYRSGALVGIESAATRPPDYIPIDFVDWPFTKTSEFDSNLWEQHVEVVKEERPKYAVAPDITEDLPLRDALDLADQLDRYAEKVIVVPKAVKPSAVPDRFRVGLPSQDRFGGPPHNVWEYHDVEEVHLLGGSPKRHLEFSHYVPIASVDTAAPVKAAHFGSYWNEGGWTEDDEERGLYKTLELSLSNVVREFNPCVSAKDVRERRLWLAYPPRALPSKPTIEILVEDEGLDPYVATGTRGAAPPCQEPDCTEQAAPNTEYTYCKRHDNLESDSYHR